MPATTSLTPLPYPLGTDQPFVHLDIKALAEATTESLYVAQSTAPAHKEGRRWYNTTTKTTWVSDGTQWLFVANALQVVRLRKSASQSINTGGVVLTWDTETEDPVGMHSGSNEYITIPEAGEWYLEAHLPTGVVTSGALFGAFRVGASTDYQTGEVQAALGSGFGMHVSMQRTLDLAAGDTVRVLITATSAATSVNGGLPSAGGAEFIARRVG